MSGLVPGIHVLLIEGAANEDVDGRDKPGHDEATEQRGVSMSYREVSEVRDGMRIDWDMPIEMDDGLVVRADIFRPVKKGRYPVLLSYGPYGKWLHFEDGYKTAWKRMEEKHPDVMAGTTNRYASWEVC